MNMIDIGISAQERRPFGINDPSNIGLRAGLANQGNGRQGVHNIAERARLNDEN